MATHVNIFNTEWCELIFVQRNQSYGAFEIRQNSAKRHLIAIMITLSVFISIISLPLIFHKDKVIHTHVGDGTITLTKLTTVEADKKIIIPQTLDKIPSNFRPTIAFVPPVIKEDWEVTKADSIPPMDILNTVGADISSITVKGDPGSEIRFTQELIAEAPADNTIHTYVGQMPHFPGGDSELLKYLGGNINYPQIAIDNGMSGTVTVQFVVFANGQIGNIQVLRGFDESCEREACRVIKAMNKWIPGKQNGNPVNVQMSVPVRFKLQDRN